MLHWSLFTICSYVTEILTIQHIFSHVLTYDDISWWTYLDRSTSVLANPQQTVSGGRISVLALAEWVAGSDPQDEGIHWSGQVKEKQDGETEITRYKWLLYYFSHFKTVSIFVMKLKYISVCTGTTIYYLFRDFPISVTSSTLYSGAGFFGAVV